MKSIVLQNGAIEVLEEVFLAPRHLGACWVVLVAGGATLAAGASVLLIAEALRIERLQTHSVTVAWVCSAEAHLSLASRTVDRRFRRS